jgi:hypothetical protein
VGLATHKAPVKGFEGNRLHLRLPSQASWRKDSHRYLSHFNDLWKNAFFSADVERYGLSKLALAMPPLEALSDLFYP